jgi:acyl dehydratase
MPAKTVHVDCFDNTFAASYTDRDVILYALSIGVGSDQETYDEDLKYVFEKHDEFSVFPTFCLALIFLADRENSPTSRSLPIFPPPLMATTGILPPRFLKSDLSIDEYPVLHTFQSITWTNELQAPKCGQAQSATLQSRITSVAPKSIGTFVSTETSINQGRALVCSIFSTALVLGLSKDKVCAYFEPGSMDSADESRHVRNDNLSSTPTFEAIINVVPNMALLYRVGSGDSNQIHVNPQALPMAAQSDQAASRPILHGLCTLGLITRLLLQYERNASTGMQFIRAEFSKPVFIGDHLVVQFWRVNGSSYCVFKVKNMRGEVVIRNGYARLRSTMQRAKL